MSSFRINLSLLKSHPAFLAFIDRAELVIHNAGFDVGFMDYEFSLLKRQIQANNRLLHGDGHAGLCEEKHPGQKQFGCALQEIRIDNSHRDFHGALLDAEILVDVYLAMTGGQTKLMLEGQGEGERAMRLKSSGYLQTVPV